MLCDSLYPGWLILKEKINPTHATNPTVGPPCSNASGSIVEQTIAIKPPAPNDCMPESITGDAFSKNKYPTELLIAEIRIKFS